MDWHVCCIICWIPDARWVAGEGRRPQERARARTLPVPNPRILHLFLSQYIPRRVESRYPIAFMDRKWTITPALNQYVWLAVRPADRGFYVLEIKPDPTNPVIPPILGKYRFRRPWSRGLKASSPSLRALSAFARPRNPFLRARQQAWTLSLNRYFPQYKFPN